MAKVTLTVEEEIRKMYCVTGDEWLVEKGKVKEARLLKRACERIEAQGYLIRELRKKVNEAQAKKWKRQAEIEKPLEDRLTKKQREFWDLESKHSKMVREIKHQLSYA
tara:strand:+ start:1572 stop:1895 length:324 start_codon:yes stop_codon:yes gene_type:complete